MHPERSKDNAISDRLTKRTLALATYLSLAVAVVPALSALRALPAMQFNSAFGLLLAAGGVFFTVEHAKNKNDGTTACIIAAVLLILGLFSFGITFAVFGAALFGHNLRFVPIRAGQVLALGTAASSLGVATIYVPFVTAVSVFLVSVALLCSRPKDGVMSLITSDTHSGSVARKVLLAAVLALPVAGVSVWMVRRQRFDSTLDISLFALVMLGFVLRTTWRAARQGERDELRTRAVVHAFRITNERLRKALEERRIFEALIENSSDFIGIVDPNGKPKYINRAGRRMVGLPDDYPVENTQISEYYPSDHRASVSALMIRSLAERGHWKGETYFRHWQSEQAIPVLDEHFIIRDTRSGRVLGMGTITRDISDLRRSEEQMRLSQERFELALRGAELAAWDWNIQTGEVIYSPRWAEMRGLRPEEVKPHLDSWISGVHPEDWPRVQKDLNDYLQGITPEYQSEFRVLTKAGNWIWILDRGKVFTLDEHGRPYRMAGTEIDITDRKCLEEQLRLAEARSSGILSISADAIISIDENLCVTLFNEGAEEIFGYSKDEVIGTSIEPMIAENFRAEYREQVRRFLTDSKSPRRIRGRYGTIYGRRKNGEEFPADAAVSKLEVSGQWIMTVSLRDITEQKRIEREQSFLAEVGAVLTSTLDYEDTLGNIAGLTVRYLADFCNIDVVEDDGTIKRLKAMSRDPAMSWVSDLFMRNPLDRSSPYYIRRATESKRPVLIEHLSQETIMSFCADDADRRALLKAGLKSLIAVPLLVRGKLVGLIALISSSDARIYRPTDVRLAEELATRAAFSIENARLLIEAKLAVATREDVLAIVSHDLKNPVSTIGLVAHLLRQFDDLDADKAGKLADTIQRSVDRMRVLITDLLDFARIQSGTFTVETHADSLIRVAGSVVDGFRLLAENKRQKLETDLPGGLPEVVVDANRIGQVMSNLLSNAIKFTPEGGTIRVSARQQGREVVVSVADTGPGIPSDHLRKVFDWFWQAQRSRHMGSGLGLSIAKGIVEAHHGRIWAESQLGKGSAFFFTLPLKEDVRRAA